MAKVKAGPIAKLIGFRLLECGDGMAVCTLKTRQKHLNPVGRVHGGILCDLADATMGYACLSHFSGRKKGVTANFQINFLKGARPGDHLTCTAQTLSHGRSLYFMECEIRNGSGILVAKAASTCKIIPNKSR